MKHSSRSPLVCRALLGATFLSFGVTACGGQVTGVLGPELTDGTDEPVAYGTATKVDVLFAIDSSGGMLAAQQMLANSVFAVLRNLINPRCVDANGATLGHSSLDERGKQVCPRGGSMQHAPIHDIHVGVITSSLDNVSGEHGVCTSAKGITLDHAQLVNRAGVRSEPEGFLAFGGGTNPYTDVDELVSATAALIRSVGESGCGFESQLESIYQFLNAPDPWARVEIDSSFANYAGSNDAVLRQRRAFLRPDSLVSVILLTDEDDASLDPLMVNGTSFHYASNDFPGGNIRPDDPEAGRTAARGTAACATDPNATSCTTCALAAVADDPACLQQRYHQPEDDPLAIRFFDMKPRFGFDPRYPLSRYVRGLTARAVPSRDREHLVSTNELLTYNYDVSADNCVNPLFAAALPASADEELCALPRGPRDPSMVYFTIIGGVPHDLTAGDALDLDGRLPDSSWTRILGRDFERYDRTGIDPRMLPSSTPREGRPGPGSPDFDDDGNVRDWDTQGGALQYACAFLPNPHTAAMDQLPCDPSSPLCENGKKRLWSAEPSQRPLGLARALGRQGVVGSLCAPRIERAEGYASIFNQLSARMAKSLPRP